MKKEITDVTVIGAGNIGLQLAVILSAKGYRVTLVTSRPSSIIQDLQIRDIDAEKTIAAKIYKITDSYEVGVSTANCLFITHPAMMFMDTAKKIEPFVKRGLYIGIVPGTGGAEYAFKQCLEKGAVLFGIQRVPSVARVSIPGQLVSVQGYRKELKLASIPIDKTDYLCDFISDIFSIPCKPLPNYLNVTLTPSNPILHTSRLYVLFEHYCQGTRYARNPLFYGEWDDESSRTLLACDEELQAVCSHIDLDLSDVISLKIHYENDTIKGLTQKISSIESLKQLLSPMKKTDNGWIPDFNSRYFLADFNYGLSIIQQIARIFRVPTPTIDLIMEWYIRIRPSQRFFDFNDFGIKSTEDFYKLYRLK